MNKSGLRLLPKDVLVEILIPEIQYDLKKHVEILEAKVSLLDAMMKESRLVIDNLVDNIGANLCMTCDCINNAAEQCSGCYFHYCLDCWTRFNETRFNETSGIRCDFCERMAAVQDAQLKNELKMQYLNRD